MRESIVLFQMAKKNWYSLVPLVNSLEDSDVDAEIGTSFDILRDLKEKNENYKEIICCISFFTTQRKDIVNLVDEIHRMSSKVSLVAGGPHATSEPEETLEMGFDAVVRGEGEIIFPNVVATLLDLETPPDGWPIIQGKPVDSLDRFPPISMKHGLYPPIEITRGCLFGCGYCSVPGNFASLRHRSVKSILDAAKELLSLRGRWDFRFISPNSLGYGSYVRKPNEDAVRSLLKSLREIEGKKRIFFATFPSEARPDFVTEGMVDIVGEFADNRSICIGAQSGSDEILRSINRGHDVKSVYRAVETILRGGIKPVVDFILGLPMEKESDQLSTLEAMREIIRMGGEVRVHHFLPLAGSVLAGMEPAPIVESVMSEIGRMALVGDASGSFNEQMKMSREIIQWEKLSSLQSKL